MINLSLVKTEASHMLSFLVFIFAIFAGFVLSSFVSFFIWNFIITVK